MKASDLKPGQFPQGTEARVCQDIAERQAMGTAKYGTTVERNPLCLLEWLEHAYQECLDQAVYLKRAMEELQTGKNVTGWDDEPQSEPDAIKLLRDIQDAAELGDDEYHVPIRFIDAIDRLLGVPTAEGLYQPRDGKWVLTPAPLQLREGAWYRRDDNAIVGPANKLAPGDVQSWKVGDWWYPNDGKFLLEYPRRKHDFDLIAEVPPPVEPVRSPLACDSMDLCDCMVRQWVGKCPHAKEPLPTIDAKELAATYEAWLKEQPVQFKAGDWVVCVDAKDSLDRLMEGKVYEVVDVDETGDVAVEKGLFFWASRFRRATPAEVRREWCRVMDWDAEMVSRCIVDDPPTDIAEESEQLKAALSIAQINESQPVPDADGWIPWDKGYCPPGLHDELIEVRTTASGNLGERPAKVTYWGNSKLRPEDNITHYRLLHSPQPVTDWVEVVTR